MKLTKIAAAFLAVAMVFTGCGSKDVSWIAKQGDTTVAAGVYLSFLLNNYVEARNLVEDKESDILKQQVEGMDASQWITQESMRDLKDYLAVEQKFEESGIAIAQSDSSYVEQESQYIWSFMQDTFEENGISYDSFQAVNMNSFKKSLLFNAQYGIGGTDEVPQEEILEYFQNNYYKVEFVTLSLFDDTGSIKTGDAKQEVVDKANEYLDLATKEGGSFADAITAFRKDNDLEVSETEPVDESTYISFMTKEDANYPEVAKAMADMKDGETKVIEGEYAIYVAQKLSFADTAAEDVTAYTNDIISVLRDGEFETQVSAWIDEVPDDVFNQEALKLYTPDKVKY